MANRPKAKAPRDVIVSDEETMARLYRFLTAIPQRNQWVRELFPGLPDPQAIALTIKRLHEANPTIAPSEFCKMKASEVVEYLRPIVLNSKLSGRGKSQGRGQVDNKVDKKKLSTIGFTPAAR